MKKVKNYSNLDFVLLSNGLAVNVHTIVGVQPNPDKKDEFYVHTTTSQYYKIGKQDYEFLLTHGLSLGVVEEA